MSPANDRKAFEDAVRLLQVEAAAVGSHLEWESALRRQYNVQVERYVQNLRQEVLRGRMTWRAAAEDARNTRDAIMQTIRQRSTAPGRAFAQAKKAVSPTMNELVAKYTIRLYGKNANYHRLTAAQQNAVYAEIVAASGRANPKVNAALVKASRLGRGLIVVSIAVSVYNIATADDKVQAAGREVVYTGAGLAGSVAGGAAAGLMCGPGAPVCVTIGAFVGGAIFVLGAQRLW